MEAGQRPRRVAVLGHYHGGNQGDDLTVAAIVQHVRARCPEAEIVGFSNRPADTTARHGIPALPVQLSAECAGPPAPAAPPALEPASAPRPLRRQLRRVPALRRLVRALRRARRVATEVAAEPGFLWRSWRRLRGFDLVIVAGSHPFADWWSGPWSHPYLMFKWALLARLAGADFVPLCVGAGPIRAPLSRVFLAAALRLARHASVRDEHSARALRERLFGAEAPVLPDLVFSLDVAAYLPDAPRAQAGSGPLRVGLNPMSHADPRYWPVGDAARFEAYVDKLADFAGWLLREGHRVLLFSSELRADPRVFEDVLLRLKRDPGLDLSRLAEAHCADARELLAQMQECDVVVASRFHAIVLSHLLGVPVVALAYHEKTAELMDKLGSEHCLETDTFEVRELVAHFERARQEGRAGATRRDEALREFRHALDLQYDALLGPREPAPR
jgi:polysaccharide pyruvyl transferase WcaK-like protein